MRKLLIGLFTAVLLGLSVLLSPAAQADTKWGAITVNPSKMTTNAAYNYGSKAAAQTAALNKCRGNCVVQVTFNACGAVGYSPGARQYTGGAATTRAQAEKKARAYADSRIVESICNG